MEEPSNDDSTRGSVDNEPTNDEHLEVPSSSRRNLLRGAAAGVAGTALAGCSGIQQQTFESAAISLNTQAKNLGYAFEDASESEVKREISAGGQTVEATIISHVAAYNGTKIGGRTPFTDEASVGLVSTPNASVLDQNANPAAEMSMKELLESDFGKRFLRSMDLGTGGWSRGPVEVGSQQVTMLDDTAEAKTFVGVTSEGDLALINAARRETGGDLIFGGDARSRTYEGSGDLAGAIKGGVQEEAAALFAEQVAPNIVLQPPGTATTTETSTEGGLQAFDVAQNGLTAAEAEELQAVMAEQFNADPELFELSGGALEYFDAENFRRVPQTEIPAEESELEMPSEADQRPDTFPAIDRAGIEEMPEPPSADAAASEFMGALEEAGLDPRSRVEGGNGADRFSVTVKSYQAPIELFDAEGNKELEKPVDTTVSLRTAVDGHELVGGGAKIRATFAAVDGQPFLTHLRYTHPKFTPGSGSNINAVEFDDDKVNPGDRYAQDLPWAEAEPELSGTLVYPVPSPEENLQETVGSGEFQPSKLVPQYQAEGTVDAGGEVGEIDLIGTFVPAAQPGELAPQVSLDATPEGNEVVAEVNIDGGQPPYQVSWGAEAGVAAPDGGEQATILLQPRESIDETEVSVAVVDANGVSATASTTVEVNVEGTGATVPSGALSSGAAVPSKSFDTKAIGGVPDFGFEGSNWGVGWDNGYGFVEQMRKGPLKERFSLQGEWAWERDYRDPSGPKAYDEDWGDNADFQFYCGHGCPRLFTFKDSDHEKGYFPYWNGNQDWGDFDAEWIALYSCSVMKPDLPSSNPAGPCGQCDGKSVVNRWGDNFDGLHIMMGFQALAITWVGYHKFSTKFGRYLRNGDRVYHAWCRAISNHQPNSSAPDGFSGRGRVIAPYGPNLESGLYDKIWGKGHVGPDVPSSQISGWCAFPVG